MIHEFEHRGGSYLQYAEDLTPEERERGLDEALRMFDPSYVPPPGASPPRERPKIECANGVKSC